ncbi:GNAT family N-acetyltransferase, partial [Vibrio parahaemolyticus]|nr:GNAT family N-acetyltransferase [Vibrio parahaemolyticus]
IYDVEQVGTNAIEIELQKQFENETDDWIHLLPVDEKNYFLGNYVTVTSEQLHSNLVLAIPEAIQAAFDNEFSEPYFICLNNEVIGYTALVFDQTIPNEEDRYWLWQFTVDKSYQNKGYGTKAMEIIVEQFRNKAVPVITLSTKSD